MKRTRLSASVLRVSEALMNEAVGVMAADAKPSIESVTLLFDQLQLSDQQIADRMCPVRLSDGKAQVWVLPEHAHDDQARALVLALSQLDLPMAQPPRVIVSAATLGELNRGLRHGHSTHRSASMTASIPKHVLVSLLDDLVGWALRADASDIHLTVRHDRPCADVAFTVNGCCVRPEPFAQLSTNIVQELLAVCWMTVQGGNGAVFDTTCEQQGRFERQIGAQTIGLRWASLVVQGGVSVCWRLLNRVRWQAPPSLDTLGYCDVDQSRLLRATHGHGGLVVFAGLVGSGKSTSLAALMQWIPDTRKIITLEDPVEYVVPNALQCPVSGFEAQAAASGLASKLKTIKRSAAHDVLIGELRDTLGGQAVVDLVLAGTNVYTTVHASSALQILTRLSSALIGVPETLLVMPGFVKLLVYQVLLKRLCEHCALDANQWSELPDSSAIALRLKPTGKLKWLEQLSKVVGGGAGSWQFRNPDGCRHCAGSDDRYSAGYGSRLLISEMIEPATLPGFYGALADQPLWNQVAHWQGLAGNGVIELPGYIPVAQVARDYLQAGLLDPRDYVVRFAPASQELSCALD
jgi:type II secretory ATPase GspE/PulE/Tfp pilus assembly ATPase PilB-like protein